MENNRRAVDERQPNEGILELVTRLGARDDAGRVDRVGVVAPSLLDLGNRRLVPAPPRSIDGQVVDDASQPNFEGSIPPVRRAALDDPQKGVLHHIGGGVGITGQSQGEAVERRRVRLSQSSDVQRRRIRSRRHVALALLTGHVSMPSTR